MLQYDYNKITICLGNYQAEFENFIQVVNGFINAIYFIVKENMEDYKIILNNKLELLLKRNKNIDTLECFINEEKINITIKKLLNEIENVCEKYFSTHPIEKEKKFEYTKYQKLKSYKK